MKDVIFREYDIRGIVDQELYIDEVYDLTKAIAYYFYQNNSAIKVVSIGMDGRLHSPLIQKEVCRAFIESGIDVIFIGVCPTPAFYFSLFTRPVDAGLMITASHNTKEYNGIKICMGTSSVWGKELQTIKFLYKQKAHISSPTSKGIITNVPIVETYTTWLIKHFDHLKQNPIPLVIDCGNGAAGTVLPHLVSQMQWPNVSLLYSAVDGNYPHHEADPTVEKNMQDLKQVLQTTGTELGVGLDGDCDRMAALTREGFLVPGDQLLALFSKYVVHSHPGSTVVFDIKSSAGLVQLLHAWGARPIMSPSGHSIIKNMMQQYNALLAGELSGHFFFKDRYFGYDDGIYAMLRLIEIIITTHQSLPQLLTFFPHFYSTPEFRIACHETEKKAIIANLISLFSTYTNIQIITIDGIRVTFPYGWGLIRASNTQAILSMRFESSSKTDLKKIISSFYDALQPYVKSSALKTLSYYMESL